MGLTDSEERSSEAERRDILMTDERKTASIEFRATPSAKARWQEAAGGPRKLSAWLTQLADARVAELADAAASSTAAERREGSTPSPSIESGTPSDAASVGKGEPRAVMSGESSNEGAPAQAGAPLLVEQESSAGQCPRWMHHRSGVYCGTCKKVN